MILPRLLGLCFAGLGVAASMAPVAARADCRDIGAAFNGAVQTGDMGEVRRLFEAAWTEPSCDDAFRKNLGRVTSLVLGQAAQQAVASGAALEVQEPLLRQALTYGRTWPVLAMLGDIEHDRRNYADASVLYQEALTLIDDEVATPRPPPVETIKAIFQRAAQSQLLSDTYIATPANRAGEPSGLAQNSFRGWEVTSVPAPITFVVNEATFTPKGRQAAEDMANYLVSQNPARITIIGHTDDRGTTAHNQGLSERRARAVADFLRSRGFAGQIVTVGRGEGAPFQADDPARYNQGERWQMDRRVELIR